MSTPNKGGWELRIVTNQPFDEVTSALQKCIRRGLEYEACWWAYLLYASGYGDYTYRRLSIIASEDIGNGDPQATILVSSLRESCERLHKHNKDYSLDKFLFIAQAILYMCRCSKSREADNLANLIEEDFKSGKRLEIPVFAQDPHTGLGRQAEGSFGDLTDGKEETRVNKWFSEWAVISNKAYQDKWEEEIKNIWIQRAKDFQISTGSQSSPSKSPESK
jgi:replication-associated recombination protein RarA